MSKNIKKKQKEIVDFSISRQIKEGEFWSKDINQNYHPSGYFGEESKRIVYSKDVINLTNFYPILLKEWFFILKKEGYLVIDYLPNKILDTNSIEKLFGGYGVKDMTWFIMENATLLPVY